MSMLCDCLNYYYDLTDSCVACRDVCVDIMSKDCQRHCPCYPHFQDLLERNSNLEFQTYRLWAAIVILVISLLCFGATVLWYHLRRRPFGRNEQSMDDDGTNAVVTSVSRSTAKGSSAADEDVEQQTPEKHQAVCEDGDSQSPFIPTRKY